MTSRFIFLLFLACALFVQPVSGAATGAALAQTAARLLDGAQGTEIMLDRLTCTRIDVGHSHLHFQT